MKNLSTSQLNRINDVNTPSSVYTEIYLSSGKPVKTPLDKLIDYVFNYTDYDINKMYNLFDIFQSPVNIDKSFFWSLCIDSSNTISLSNKSAPNWLYGYSKTGIDTNIKTTNPQFWNSLISLKNSNSIRFELVSNMSDATIASTQYMSEYTENGFTNIFLINEFDGYVALPCLNSAFLRCVQNGNNQKINTFGFDTDKIKYHTHTLQSYYFNTLSTETHRPTYADYVTGDTFRYISTNIQPGGNSETVPNNVRYNMYMCVKTDITPKIINITYTKTDKIPIGAIIPNAKSIIDDPHYLICDGSEYKISDYQELFNSIGFAYCITQNGWVDSTNRDIYFRVPDLRNRYIYNSNINTQRCNIFNSNTRKNTFTHFHGTGTDVGKNDFYWSTRPTAMDIQFYRNYSYMASWNYYTITGINTINLKGGSDGTTNELYTSSTTTPIELVNISVNYIIKAK